MSVVKNSGVWYDSREFSAFDLNILENQTRTQDLNYTARKKSISDLLCYLKKFCNV